MAKKTIKQNIQDTTQELTVIDQQIKVLQDKKRQVKQTLQQLNDDQIAELGRQLLAKMNLNPDDVDAAFDALDTLPIAPQKGLTHEN